jgi:hypothetical protein
VTASLDSAVRLAVYRHFVEHCVAPSVTDLARATGAPAPDVEGALRRLAEGRALVLRPRTSDIWMAMPFSADPTEFRVESAAGGWWANCAWDALGLAAMLGAASRITTRCPDCGKGMSLAVHPHDSEAPLRVDAAGEPIVHFLVPAARWWDDIGFT